jgi:hypothetical protein
MIPKNCKAIFVSGNSYPAFLYSAEKIIPVNRSSNTDGILVFIDMELYRYDRITSKLIDIISV